jgi:cobalt-zinc-cadmium efflux system membrane fusion protein
MARALATSVVLSLAVSCSEPSGADEQAAEVGPEERLVVRVDPALVDDGRIALGAVALTSPEDMIRATGRVRPDIDGEARVSALVPGVVRRVMVREGQDVKAGDLLAEMDVPEAARVAGQLARARASLERARKTLERKQKLVSFGGAARRELEAAEADVALARADQRAAGMLLRTWGTQDGHLRVKAPIRGRVVHRAAALGERMDGGDELFRIVDLDKLVIAANVLERDAHRVSVGAEARLRLLSDAQCPAVVEAVSGEVEPGQRSVAVRLRTEACPGLLAGQLVEVELSGARSKDANAQLTVPRDAVVSVDGVHTVFVAGDKPGAYRARAVTVDRFTNVSAVLATGPESGTQVVVRGAILLKGELMRATLE